MERGQQHKRKGFRRVQEILNQPPLAGNPSVAPKRAVIDSVLSSLDQLGAEQQQADRDARRAVARGRAQRRQLLERHVRPLAATLRAEVGAELLEPVAAQFRVPPSKAPVEVLLDVSAALRQAAEPFTEQLVAAGHRPDCLERFEAAAKAVRASADDYARCFARRVGATAAIREAIEEGQRAVVILDAVVREQLEGRPEEERLLAEWKSAVRATRSAGHSSAVAEEGPADAVGATTAAPTVGSTAPAPGPTEPTTAAPAA